MELLVFIVSVTVSAAVGVFVVARDPRKLLNVTYGMLTLSFIVLSVANFMTLSPGASMISFIRITILATTIAIATLYFLVRQLQTTSGDESSLNGRYANSLVILTAIVGVLSVSPYVVSGAGVDGYTAPVFGVGVIAFLIHFILFGYLSLRVLVTGLRSGDDLIRSQFLYIIIGMIPAVVFAPITGIVLPTVFSQEQFIFLTPLYVAFFVLMVAYAMIKHRLFDIRLAAVRTIAYVLSLAALSGLYYTVAYLASRLIFKEQAGSTLSVGPLNIFLALILAFAFQPIRRFFDKATNSIFYRDNYDSDDFFARINKLLTSTADLRTMLRRLSVEIGDTLKAERASFFVYHTDDDYVSVGDEGKRGLSLRDAHVLDGYTIKHDGRIVIANLLPSGDSVRRLLDKYEIAMLLPLVQAGEVIGYLALGGQKSGHYTERDVKVLTTISDSLVVAIQNLLSVQEIKDFNEHLQQKIDAATTELRASNAQLRRLDATKDEFVSMASHQLRTPLTSVKGYISMVLEGDAGKISDMQAKLLGEAFTSSERMVHLINDFLNVSRLQTGRFMLDRRQVDLANVVQQEVDSLQTTAKARNIKMQYRQPSVFPVLYLDEGKLRQVIMNFIDNAFYYSREFTTVTVKAVKDGGDVVVTVTDSGMGVPEAEQKRLFTKFFRATNARKQRPDGTGVGLFLAKKVIVAHGGAMIFESTEGKGSTFGFRLPIKKLSLAPADDADKLDD